MSIAENISSIRQTLPSNVALLCVSKYHTAQQILEAYNAGMRDFGESRAQELETKATELPQDIRWHFIGHLQRNKVKTVAKYASVIQSVDSQRLLLAIEQAATQPVDVLLEIHIAQEDTKTGLDKEQLHELLQYCTTTSLHNIRIRGLMGMATRTADKEQIRSEFRLLRQLFVRVKEQYFAEQPMFDTLSMGMSDDYLIAIEEGSTMVRIGSSIFNQ